MMFDEGFHMKNVKSLTKKQTKEKEKEKETTTNTNKRNKEPNAVHEGSCTLAIASCVHYLAITVT